MPPNVPAAKLFSTLPALPPDALLLTMPELRDRLALLEGGGDMGFAEQERWKRAAADDQWTADELLDAVRRLNIDHTGYVKIAHVSAQVEKQRKALRIARIYSWQHQHGRDVIGDFLDHAVDEIQAERFWQDFRHEWLTRLADKVMERMPATEWRRWATENAGNFRSDL